MLSLERIKDLEKYGNADEQALAAEALRLHSRLEEEMNKNYLYKLLLDQKSNEIRRLLTKHGTIN